MMTAYNKLNKHCSLMSLVMSSDSNERSGLRSKRREARRVSEAYRQSSSVPHLEARYLLPSPPRPNH